MFTPILPISMRRHVEPDQISDGKRSCGCEGEFDFLVEGLCEESYSSSDDGSELQGDHPVCAIEAHESVELVVLPACPHQQEASKATGRLDQTQYLVPSVTGHSPAKAEVTPCDEVTPSTHEHLLIKTTEKPETALLRLICKSTARGVFEPGQDGPVAVSEVRRSSMESGILEHALEPVSRSVPESPPVLQVLQQISSSLLRGGGQPETVSPTHQGHAFAHLSDHLSPLKSLRFTLQPKEMGEVEVTLRRTGTVTNVTIRVASTMAVEAVRRDMSVLEDRLGSLLASMGSNSSTVSMDILGPEPVQGAPGTPGSDRGADSAEFSRGHGSGQDGRSESRAPPTRGIRKGEMNEEGASSSIALGAGRVV